MLDTKRLIVAGASAVTIVAVVAAAGAMVACNSSPVRVATITVDSAAPATFKTFAIKSLPVDANVGGAAVVRGDKNQAAGSVVMDMDPMAPTSPVGIAMRQDISDAFSKRGYQNAQGPVDFYVAYYAGTGSVVSTRASEKSYKTDGRKITTETYEYPAGTIVVDVVNARNDSLVWRGTGLAAIPGNPKDYADAIQNTVDKIVGEFPMAKR
jgi:uncharacterized protein DUF4136